MNKRCSPYHTVIGYHVYNRFFFSAAFGRAFHFLKRAWTCRRFAVFAYFCVTPAARVLGQATGQALSGWGRGRRARLRKKRMKRPASCRKKQGLEARRAPGVPVLRRDDSGYCTYIHITWYVKIRYIDTDLWSKPTNTWYYWCQVVAYECTYCSSISEPASRSPPRCQYMSARCRRWSNAWTENLNASIHSELGRRG